MAEYIEREAVMQKFADHVRRSNNSDFASAPTWNQAVQIVEDIPAADVVPVGAYNQAAWERDTAIEQLKQIGKSFGEKMDDVRPVVRGKWGYRWKIHGDWRRPTELFPCSVCGFENTSATNFCPNCGADMQPTSM